MLIFNKSSNTFTSSLFPETINHGFGTRMSGNGRDIENINTYLTAQRIVYKKVIDPDQKHTDNIVVVSDNLSIDVNNCDGLITKEKGVVLTVITADCAPILYVDPVKNIVGISHNGRKGTEKKLASKMVKKFYALGSKLADVRIAIGPAIGACCYPMNLLEENVKQLVSSGIKKDQLDFFPFCTKCDSDRFFSYRNMRDTPNFPEQFSFIALSKDISA